jgi:uncharacterized protein YjbI with pentapeptide repeats
MIRTKIKRVRVPVRRVRPRVQSKETSARLGQVLNVAVKVSTVLASLSLLFALWSMWRVFGPSVDATAVLAASTILAAVSILWIPKLQIMRVKFHSNLERFNAENEARKSVATLVGGLAIFGSFYTAQRQLGVQQQAQFTDRYTKAIEEIAASDDSGNPKLAVRVGGLYVLEQIMNSSEAQHASILEVLCAYIRDNSLQKILKPDDGPRADTRVALTILGRRDRDLEQSAEHKKGWRLLTAFFTEREFLNAFTVEFVRPRLDLSGSDLANSELSHLVLAGADFSGAKLSNCKALFSDFNHANFNNADLSDCVIASTIDDASFAGANLEGAIVAGKVSRAKFADANLRLSIWIGADLVQPADIKAAKNWEIAFYSDKDLAALGLPPDHNDQLLKIINSRTPAVATVFKLRVASMLKILKEATQSLQDSRDPASNPETPKQTTR